MHCFSRKKIYKLFLGGKKIWRLPVVALSKNLICDSGKDSTPWMPVGLLDLKLCCLTQHESIEVKGRGRVSWKQILKLCEELACWLQLSYTHTHTLPPSFLIAICSLKMQVGQQPLRPWYRQISRYNFGLRTLVILRFTLAPIMITQKITYFESVQERVMAVFKFYLPTNR